MSTAQTNTQIGKPILNFFLVFLMFLQVYDSVADSRGAPRPEGWRPPLGKSWIRHWQCGLVQ